MVLAFLSHHRLPPPFSLMISLYPLEIDSRSRLPAFGPAFSHVRIVPATQPDTLLKSFAHA
jgi:hypothetical protein